MKFPLVSCWFVVITTPYLTLVASGAEKHEIQDNPNNLRPRRNNKECPEGFGGTNCNVNIDECKKLPYPCAGGVEKGSFCVDYNPPEKFKCGCRSGYNAILPDAKDVKDNVPVEWRPLQCVPKDACVDVVCHEDATCKVSSTNTATCICNDGLVGDGITSCTPPPAKKPPSSQQTSSCKIDSDCTKLVNSVCVEGVCKCKDGFYRSSGKGRCINENECAAGFPNRCHKNAVCTDTEGSYTCACKDGFQDVSSDGKTGTTCAQINECLNPSLHDCNLETQVCLDRAPPTKWQCVDRTPAPTPAPTCNDDGITVFRRTSLKANPATFFDTFTNTCSELSTRESSAPVCNCQGLYSFSDTQNVEMRVTGRSAGTMVRDVCCYCKSVTLKCFYDK